jgi:UDP-glucuronate 4-epimerase
MDASTSTPVAVDGTSSRTPVATDDVMLEDQSSSDTDENGASSDADSSEEAEQEGSIAAHKGPKIVMVTGVAGFIGSHCAERLIARGDIVIGVDEVNDYYDPRMKRANLARVERLAGSSGRFKFFEGDLCDKPFIESIFATERPTWMLHLAARAGVRPSIDDPFIYIHSNIEATTRLLELARTFGCEHFVFASSSSVYGGSPKTLFSEMDDVSNPVSPYAATKKSCELIGYTFNHLYDLPVAGLRFFTVYGPGGRPDMAPFKFVDRVSRGVEIQQFGDGSSSRDYTYIDDIVDGCIRTLDRPSGYQVYNLGNGEPTRLRDFIDIVQRETQREAVIKILPDQPGDVPRTCADITKARQLLGYNPKTRFADGMAKTVSWYTDEYAPRMARDAEEAAAAAAPLTKRAAIKRPVSMMNFMAHEGEQR